MLRERRLNGIPAIDVPTVQRFMAEKRKLELPAQEGEAEYRLRRKEIDKSLLRETTSFMLENCIYPYSVHLPAYQLGDGETASDVIKAIDTIIEAVDPALFVLHVSKPPLLKWGSEVRDILRNLPPDRTIALENVGVDGDKMRFPDRVGPVLSAIGDPPDNLGFCLDITHVVPRNPNRGTIGEKEAEIFSTILAFMDAMGSRLRHMHLSNTRYEGTKRLQHLPFDEGVLDIARIKTELSVRGFGGKCVLEFAHCRVADGIEAWNRS
ncbi:MAG: TIM barrel protein [Candidatus Micrarchaeia archaeon]